ncbi:MAG: hypothetical protein COA43_11160 [Robiginitomaculum sp.]|nr:MAG: hypothetical protein COA43_11160 [Robiginitomaculum sp.]
MRAATLRDVIYVDRRGTGPNDGYGNTATAWERFTPPAPKNLYARIIPLRGNETLIAGRAAGVVLYEITVRYSSLTKDICSSDRIVNARSGVTYNITAVVNLDMRSRYLILSCSTGGSDG